MKFPLFLMGSVLLLASCKNDSSQLATADNQVIEYKMDNNQYAVIVVQAGGMSEDDVKALAMKKAAEKTRDQKMRYFTVESEDHVQAMSSTNTAYDNPSPQRNMYYEMIQSDNFGRDRFQDERNPQENTYPAYRVIFKCYQDKPSGGAKDACEFVSCQ